VTVVDFAFDVAVAFDVVVDVAVALDVPSERSERAAFCGGSAGAPGQSEDIGDRSKCWAKKSPAQRRGREGARSVTGWRALR
jgi:hypothetical protein